MFVHFLHISWPIFVKFGAADLNMIILLCENWSSESYSLFDTLNEIFPHFLPYWSDMDNIQYRDAHKNMLRDCKFCENQHNESHALLQNINKFLFL
jgi:hypothetical protein